MARMNITDVREFCERAVDKAHLDKNKYPLCAKRLLVLNLTNRYSTYVDIVRKSQELFNVRIYRNESCLAEGIYIVGRENFVDQCKKWISNFISRVEQDTYDYGNPITLTGIHGNAAYSQYATKKAKKILIVVFDLIEYRRTEFKGPIEDRCTMDQILNKMYCKQLSVLKNKTKYNGDIRYIA